MFTSSPLEFVVSAPPYDPNTGGVVVLHYLCHLLNELGHKAYMVPCSSSVEVSLVTPHAELADLLSSRQKLIAEPFAINPLWNTPLYRKPWTAIQRKERLVTVYPEIVFGNPLRGKHIARWILNTPGFFNKQVFFAAGEVHFRYLEMHRPVPVPWIEQADELLTVTHVPWEHYQQPPEGHRRSGTAYLLRKGAHKPIVHDMEGSIRVDGMSHAQMGEVMRRVETFISYDTKTMYSWLAALAGADSVVIPDEGVSRDEWQPDESLRAGIAYGFGDIDRARQTRPLVQDRLVRWSSESFESVSRFAAFWIERLDTGPARQVKNINART